MFTQSKKEIVGINMSTKKKARVNINIQVMSAFSEIKCIK
jgi:hypothetical protein